MAIVAIAFNPQRLFFDSRIQSLTFKVLHDDEATAVFFADFINRADVRMIEVAAARASRMQRLLACSIAVESSDGKNFDGHLSAS